MKAGIQQDQNKSENLKVKRNLTALVEFSRIINSSLDLDFILNNILLSCMGKFFSTKGFIAINRNGILKLAASKGLSEELTNGLPNIPISNSFIESEELTNFIKKANITAFEPIKSSQNQLGFIGLGEKLNKNPYSDDDIEFLKTILNISATAIQNSLVLNELTEVNKMLDSRVHRLSSLFELSKEFGMFSESTKVAKLLVYSVIGQFLVSKFAVITIDGDKINILETKISEEILLNSLSQVKISEIENPVTKDEINTAYKELAKINIELIVPMQLQGETKGLILLGKRINNIDYTNADIEFIYSVGSLAIISLENKRLFVEALEKQKLEEELEIARDIQKNLLPHSIPEYENFEIEATNLSSKQVGGDYYDIVTLDDDSFVVAIADVAGKGVPAALLMANLQAFIKTTCKHGMRLDEATALINDLVSENISDGKFITFFWAILESDKRTISYVNAGHNHPLLIRDGKIKKLDKGGMILGVMKTMIPYLCETIELKTDDVIILFTDGVSEAMNDKGEEFSDKRLEEIALKNSYKSSKEILSLIQKEVQYFAAGILQSDDLTLMVIKVK